MVTFGRSSYGGGQGFKPSFRPRFNRPIKRLDPSLFVKKPKEQVAQVEQASDAKFEQYAIIDKLKQNIAERGYATPTPIQEKPFQRFLQVKTLSALPIRVQVKPSLLISFIDKVLEGQKPKGLNCSSYSRTSNSDW